MTVLLFVSFSLLLTLSTFVCCSDDNGPGVSPETASLSAHVQVRLCFAVA